MLLFGVAVVDLFNWLILFAIKDGGSVPGIVSYLDLGLTTGLGSLCECLNWLFYLVGLMLAWFAVLDCLFCWFCVCVGWCLFCFGKCLLVGCVWLVWVCYFTCCWLSIVILDDCWWTLRLFVFGCLAVRRLYLLFNSVGCVFVVRCLPIDLDCLVGLGLVVLVCRTCFLALFMILYL